MDLALNNLQRLICHKIQPTNQDRCEVFSQDSALIETLAGGSIHQMRLVDVCYKFVVQSSWQRTPLLNECPANDTKQSDGEVLIILELRGRQSTPSLPSLSGPQEPGVIAPSGALSMG